MVGGHCFLSIFIDCLGVISGSVDGVSLAQLGQPGKEVEEKHHFHGAHLEIYHVSVLESKALCSPSGERWVCSLVDKGGKVNISRLFKNRLSFDASFNCVTIGRLHLGLCYFRR